MMKKKVVSVILLFLLVFCGCGEAGDKREVVEEVNQEETNKDIEEEKTEGLRIVFAAYDEDFTEAEMDETIYKIRKRIENEGIEDAMVYRNAIRMINVDIPDVTDKEVLPDDIGNKGELYFVLGAENVEMNAFDETTGIYRYSLLKSFEELEAGGDIILEEDDIQTAENSWYHYNGATQNVVVLSFTEDGTEKFARITEANIGETIAIVYDGEVICAPIVQQVITDGKAIISGGLTEKAAERLANVIRIGELPLNLREISREVVEIK